MSTLQSKIEELLYKPTGTVIKKPSEAGFPKDADRFISSITIISTSNPNFNKGLEIDISWKGSTALAIVPKVSLENNPMKVIISRAVGGGLVLNSNDLLYKDAAIELTLNGNVYKIKGMNGSYSF